MCTKSQIKTYLKLQLVSLTGVLLLAACAPAAAVANPPVSTTIPTSEESTQSELSPTAISAMVLPTADVPATAVPATENPVTSPAWQPNANTGTTATFGPLSVVVPPGVASGASGRDYPRNDREDAAWWQKTPGHLQVMLGDYYVLQGQFHQPQIYVFPAQGYAELVPAAFESIRRLDNVLYGLGGPIDVDQLPTVPFFNARPLFAANIQTISFQNGGGMRFLTQYGQANAPVNNHELFYQFQGVSRDGANYLIAIFPVTLPILAATSEAATLPSGGVASPDIADPNADWDGYYTAVTGLLERAAPDAFSPTIEELDLLIESIQVAP